MHSAQAGATSASELADVLAGCLPDHAVFLLNADGRVSGWSEGAESAFGYTESEALGLAFTAFFPVDEQRNGTPAHTLDSARERRRSRDEGWRLRRDGSRFWAAMTVTAFASADGQALGYAVATREQSPARPTEILNNDLARFQEQQLVRARLLSTAAAELLSSKDSGRMVENLFDVVSAHLRLDVSFCFMVRPDGTALYLDSCAGVSQEVAGSLRHLEFGQAVCGRVAQRRSAIVATCIQQSDDPAVQLIRGLGLQAYACNPLMAGERLLGTLSFGRRSADRFSDDELEFLRTICHYVAIAKERMRIEAATQESEARFRATFDQAAVGMAHVALDGRWLSVNDRLCAITGYSREELLRTTFRAITHPDDLARDEAQARRLLDGAIQTYSMEKRYLHRQGHAVWINLTASLLRDEQGTPLQFVAVVEDISARKQAEDERDRFFTLGAGMLLVASIDGYFKRVSPEWERVLGWSEAELTSRPWLDFVHPDDRAATIAEGQRLAQGEETLTFENRYRCRDGSYRWISWCVRPYLAEGKLYGMAMDVTGRKQAEMDLQTSERRFRHVAESLPCFVWHTDVCGRMTYVNSNWTRYTGLTLTQSNDLLTLRQAVHPEDAEPLIAVWQEALRAGQPYEVEFRLRRVSDGVWRWFLLRALPEIDERGTVVGWFGTTTDIDERKRSEDATREASRRKDEFLAMLAHELRNPLAPVRNALHLLRKQGPETDVARRSREIIERQINHLVRMVDDLLEVSRIERGLITLKKAPLDLVQTVQQVADANVDALRGRDLSLRLELPAHPLHVEADVTRIEQVINNLLNNAAKFTEPGGQIRIVLEPAGREVRLRVTDTGAGIPPENLGCLFELFVQVNPTLDRAKGGLGLGLHTVRRLVEMHGGRVSAHSDGVGKGAEFVVVLPLPAHGADSDSVEMGPAYAARPKHARRVLVVEDNEDSRETLVMLLALEGHQVETAANGQTGVEKALSFRPDVAVIDIGLPLLNGFEVARRVRAALGPDVYLVALTGYGQVEDQQRALEAGFDRHQTKPMDPALLSALVQSRSRR